MMNNYNNIMYGINNNNVQTYKKEPPQYRSYQYSYPIMYRNETEPQYFAVITVTEVYNVESKKWELASQHQKMYHKSGFPFGYS